MPRIQVEPSRCKGCGLCVANCPLKLLRIGAVINEKGYQVAEQADAARCTACTLCAVICPDMAITVYR